jgi:hypothetical protein
MHTGILLCCVDLRCKVINILIGTSIFDFFFWNENSQDLLVIDYYRVKYTVHFYVSGILRIHLEPFFFTEFEPFLFKNAIFGNMI